MDQYQKQRALDWIDGYWMPQPAASEKKIAADFERAKKQFRDAMAKNVESVDAITLDQFRDFKGECFPKVTA